MMMLMLYTRKGDRGTTKFFSAKGGFASGGDSEKERRVSKASCNTEALGALDELNSFLGFVKVGAKSGDIQVPGSSVKFSEVLHGVQENLFIVQAEAAGSPDKKISEIKVKEAEMIVDAIEKEIPSITGFSISGGTSLSALLDTARAMSRKTERRIVALAESGDRDMSEHTRSYMNRLSSLLFALARYVNHKAGVNEQNPSYK